MECQIFESRHFYDIKNAVQNLLDRGSKIDKMSLSTTKVGYETYYSLIVIYE